MTYSLDLSPALLSVLPREVLNTELLVLALSHSSVTQGEDGPSNERLEFLGDAVVGVVIAEFLYSSFPNFDEGRLSKLRAAVVRSDSLARIATRLELGHSLLLGATEDLGGGRLKSSILADAFEALVGAVFLTCGFREASEFVISQLRQSALDAASDKVLGDYKSSLQELLATSGESPPTYEDSWVGPDHDRLFFSKVVVGSAESGSGSGRSKKAAEQAAAHDALKRRGYVG